MRAFTFKNIQYEAYSTGSAVIQMHSWPIQLHNCKLFFFLLYLFCTTLRAVFKKTTHDCFDRKGRPIPTSALSVHNLPTLGSVQANTVCTQCTMINPQIVYWGRNHSAKKENPSFLSTTCTLLLPSFSFNLKVLSAWKFGHGFFWENCIIHVATTRNNNITLLMAETTILIVK